MDLQFLAWMPPALVSAGLLAFAASVPAEAAAANPSPLTVPIASPHFGDLPLHFESNVGQVADEVRYFARGPGYSVFFTPRETVLSLGRDEVRAVLRLSFVESAERPAVTAREPMAGHSRYLGGALGTKPQTPIRHFGRVHYAQVYSGIDVEYYGNERQLEYDFIVAPRADAKRIKMRFDGAQALSVHQSGDLHVHTAAGTLVQRRPIVYQVRDSGQREIIASRYAISPGTAEVSFELAAYDHNRPLIIDPVLNYSTYFGGSARDLPASIAVDAARNAYVLSTTFSADFPATTAPASPTAPDVVISKISADGQTLLWSTYLTGSGDDRGAQIRTDASGNVYIGGSTNSPDFPSLGGVQSNLAGGRDAFVAKLNSEGALLWSTFLGGSVGIFGDGNDSLAGLAVDAAGSVYVSGSTDSYDFPTANAAQAQLISCQRVDDPEALCAFGADNAFVAKLASAGDSLIYSTYLATEPDEGPQSFDTPATQGGAIDVDAAGRLFLIATTTSRNDEVFYDQTLARYQPDGSAPLFMTSDKFLRGEGDGPFIQAADLKLDSAGNVILMGNSLFGAPNDLKGTPGAYQEACAEIRPYESAYVAKLSADFETIWLTNICPPDAPPVEYTLRANALALDASNSIFVTGRTDAPLPTTDGSVHSDNAQYDAFVFGLNASGTARVFASLLGGAGSDEGLDIALDHEGGVYIAGSTTSTDFPTLGPLQSSAAGNGDGFVARYAEAPAVDGCTGGPGTMQFTSPSYAVKEDRGNVRITVRRAGTGCPAASVAYATADGSAVAGQHYMSTNGTLYFPAGGTSTQTFLVPVINDLRYGHVQNLSLVLTSVTGAMQGPNATANLGIVNVNRRPAVHLSTRDRTASTGQALTLSVAMSEASNVDTNIGFQADGSATRNVDYTAPDGLRVTVPAGQTKASFVILLSDPPNPSGTTRTLTLSIVPPTNAVPAGRQSNTITIVKP